MKTHTLTQGSAEWHAHRTQYDNASDAPAMMGCSPHTTRSELLRQRATGISKDVDAATQRRFDDGHRFEALARPLAEEIIGEDLYPVVGTSGTLSASFDGLTMLEDVAFEHKSLNDELRAVIIDEDCGALLPLHYLVQMEQQLLVSGANKCLFMATKWAGDELTEQRWTWYYGNHELRAQIVASWAQFRKDVAAYVPTEAAEPAKAEPMDHLPAVSVRLDGALSVAGNLPMFANALKAFIERMPAKPTTDSEFATCEAACKALKKAEEALDAAEAGALASITDVESMRRAVAECRKLARDTRLASEKLVERRKVEIKEQAVVNARRALDNHIAALNAELAPMRLLPVAADFAAAIKGLRSIASMQDALDKTLADGKIAADGQARAIRANVATFKTQAEGFAFLFADLGQIIHKPADDFGVLVQSRLATHKAAEEKRLEAERERIRAEEASRLQREQAEAAAKVQREAEAAQRTEVAQRLADEQARSAEAAAQQRANAAAELAAAKQSDEGAELSPAAQALHEAEGAANFAGAHRSVTSAFVAPAAAERPALKLGEINQRLHPISIDAVGLALLGFDAHLERGSKLFKESDYPKICRAIAAHMETAQFRSRAALAA